MTARRTMVAMAALLVCIVLALLLGLLLVSGAREPAPPPPSPEPTPAVASPTRNRPPLTASIEEPGPEEAAPAPERPGTFRLEGTALFEDGTPCPGVHFVEMVRGDDGEPEPLLDSALSLRIESGADGAFALKWPARPAAVLLLVMSTEAEVVAVEGGSPVGPHAHGTVVSAAIPGPLALRMRWRPGYGLVRARSAVTGEVLPPGSVVIGEGISSVGLVVRWRSPNWETVVWNSRGAGVPEGWVPLKPPQESKGVPVLEVIAEGFATERIPFEAVRGRIEVSLRPLVPDVTGEISVPGAPAREFTIGWGLLPADSGGGRPLEVRGRIVGEGPFALSEVPDGRWTLEVWAVTKEGVRWGRRVFEKPGGPVDLGRVEVSGWSGFRVRCLDPDGKPLSLPFTCYRESGGSLPARDVLQGRVRMVNAGVIVEGGGAVRILDSGEVAVPHLAKARERDPDGWIVIDDCLPGARYRIAFPGPPDASVAAEAPATIGEYLPVEIRVKTRPARCVVRFTVGGAAPASWGRWLGGDLDSSSWRQDGILEARLYPGDYGLAVEAKATEGSSARVYQGSFQVPEGEVYETTVDLK